MAEGNATKGNARKSLEESERESDAGELDKVVGGSGNRSQRTRDLERGFGRDKGHASEAVSKQWGIRTWEPWAVVRGRDQEEGGS